MLRYNYGMSWSRVGEKGYKDIMRLSCCLFTCILTLGCAKATSPLLIDMEMEGTEIATVLNGVERSEVELQQFFEELIEQFGPLAEPVIIRPDDEVPLPAVLGITLRLKDSGVEEIQIFSSHPDGEGYWIKLILDLATITKEPPMQPPPFVPESDR